VVVFGVTPLSAAGPMYTAWSTPTNLGPTINTPGLDSGPALSKDGLSLYFYSDRPGGFGGSDIWVSQRKSTDDAWGAPVNLGPTINTSASELVPAFSRDGHWMFFASDRRGGYGAQDIWASWRAHVHDDFDWQAPVDLGPNVNSSANDNGVGYFANDDGGAPQLFFGSDRNNAPGNTDLYMSTQQQDGTWGPATLVAGLSSPSPDNRPALSHDGLEIYFYSARAGGLGTNTTDIWTSTRDSLDSPWSTPVNVGAPVNSSSTDIHPYISSDDQTLLFASDRPGSIGGRDLYVSTRSKVHGQG
jgi:Tol biopolymer transport system component